MDDYVIAAASAATAVAIATIIATTTALWSRTIGYPSINHGVNERASE